MGLAENGGITPKVYWIIGLPMIIIIFPLKSISFFGVGRMVYPAAKFP
jgi:hypothetical protein